MSSPLRLGIVGAGAVTQVAHLPVLKKLKPVQVVALADGDVVKASALATRFGVPYAFEDNEEMLERTHIPEAPWWVVEAVDKKRARLNCIHHMLNQIPYREVEHPVVVLPPRERKPDYHRNPIPAEMFVPAVY